jgi:hypothetical protein
MLRRNINLLEMRKIFGKHLDEGKTNGDLTHESDPQPSLLLSFAELAFWSALLQKRCGHMTTQ